MTILTWIQLGLISVGFGFMLFALWAHLKKAGTGRPDFEAQEDEHAAHKHDGLTADALDNWSPVHH